MAAEGARPIHLAHSPDADDAFMFWALATGRIDTAARRYLHELADIESLNRRALKGELEVTAVSFHAYAYLADRYALLAHGASFGDRYGPRIVARRPRPADPRAALAEPELKIAVPGELTTAFQMGVLVLLPFLVIDLAVSSVLMSLGMMMVPPTTISLPIKLLLFVVADGWHLLVGSLLRSFS